MKLIQLAFGLVKVKKRNTISDLFQTGGTRGLRGDFCLLKWHFQACKGLVCPQARFTRWEAIIFVDTFPNSVKHNCESYSFYYCHYRHFIDPIYNIN